MIEAVLFDLDGTLLNTLDDIADCANWVLAQNGWPIHDIEAYKYFVGGGAEKLITSIVPEDARAPEVLDRIRKIYLDRYQERATYKTRPYDGVPELLDALKKRGVKTAVVSNKPDGATRQTVKHFFGERRFGFVVGNRPGLPLKPDPAIVNLAIESIGASAEKCVYVGDSGTDMTTAKNAGCMAVGVTWGFRERNELEAGGADRLIDSPEELLELL
jgi:phosphoglycolate phosphatase